jgi:hypothetical protein
MRGGGPVSARSGPVGAAAETYAPWADTYAPRQSHFARLQASLLPLVRWLPGRQWQRHPAHLQASSKRNASSGCADSSLRTRTSSTWSGRREVLSTLHAVSGSLSRTWLAWSAGTSAISGATTRRSSLVEGPPDNRGHCRRGQQAPPGDVARRVRALRAGTPTKPFATDPRRGRCHRGVATKEAAQAARGPAVAEGAGRRSSRTTCGGRPHRPGHVRGHPRVRAHCQATLRGRPHRCSRARRPKWWSLSASQPAAPGQLCPGISRTEISWWKRCQLWSSQVRHSPRGLDSAENLSGS